MTFLRPVFLSIVVTVLGTSTCTPYLPTCTGLEQFMVNTDTTLAECEYDECCITVTCNTVQEMFIDVIHSSTFTLIPCSTPPSIALTVRNSTEDIFTGNLSESGHTDVFVTQMASSDFVTVISLNITVDFSILGEVGIEVDLDQVTTNMASGILANGVTQVINELTRIPLDIASCNPTTISSTNSPTTSDSIRSCLSYHLVLLALLVCLLTHESLQWRPR